MHAGGSRSQQVKDRWRKQVEDRLRHITQLLVANGFPSGHYCMAVDGYIRTVGEIEEHMKE